MLLHTHSDTSPWIVVDANDKPVARDNLIRDLLSRVNYKGRDKKLARPDKNIVDTFSPDMLTTGWLAK